MVPFVWKCANLLWAKRLNKTDQGSQPAARSARHTTEKYSLLFSFCLPRSSPKAMVWGARPIFSSFNEKSIFLWCSAFQVFRQVAGLASFWFGKRKAEFPPNPSFLPACLGFAPKTFGRTDFSADKIKISLNMYAVVTPQFSDSRYHWIIRSPHLFLL